MKTPVNSFSSMKCHGATLEVRWGRQRSGGLTTGCSCLCKITAYSPAVMWSRSAIIGCNGTRWSAAAPIMQLSGSALNRRIQMQWVECVALKRRLLVIAFRRGSGVRAHSNLNAFICWPWMQRQRWRQPRQSYQLGEAGGVYRVVNLKNQRYGPQCLPWKVLFHLCLPVFEAFTLFSMSFATSSKARGCLSQRVTYHLLRSGNL